MIASVAFICGNIYTLLADSGGTVHMGGAEVQQLLLGREFRRNGLDVYYITETPVTVVNEAIAGFRVSGY